jgi:hypothetical protein
MWRENTWLNRGALFLIQVDVALGGSHVGIFLGLPQQLVKFRIQNLAARFLGFELFAKDFIAAASLTLQLGDGSGEILDGRRFLMHFVGNNSACLRVDLEDRLATRALDVKQSFSHSTIVAQSMACAGSAKRRSAFGFSVQATGPQSVPDLIDIRGIRKIGRTVIQVPSQVHQIQSETHLLECIVVHARDIGRTAGSL